MSSNSTNSLLNGGTSSSEKVISIDDDISKEMIADVINKCVENEQIDDDSKIIISNFCPVSTIPKKVSPPVYHNPKIEKGTSN
jgi:hypothetical protein